MAPALSVSATSKYACNHTHTKECEENCAHVCDDSCLDKNLETKELIASDSNASNSNISDNGDLTESSEGLEDISISENDIDLSFETTKTSEDIANTETSSTKENNDLDETISLENSSEEESSKSNNQRLDVEQNSTQNDSVSKENKKIELFSAETPSYLDSLAFILGEDNVKLNYNENSISLIKDTSINKSINITENTILDLNGFSLRGNMTSINDNMFNVNSGLTVKGNGEIVVVNGDNAVSVSTTGTFNLENGNISSISSNRAIFVAGTFNMSGGSISGNSSSANGSAILVNNGALFNMSGGEISNNTTNVSGANNGGSIVFQRSSTGNIRGNAIIKNNASSSDGGAIIVKLNSFLNIYENAQIINNNALRGGGIYSSSSKINIYGNSKINENETNQNGNDIYLTDSSTCSLSGDINVGDIFVSDNSIVEDKTSNNASTDLQKLIDETVPGGTLVLTKDYNKEIPLYIKKDITIDFAGYSITSNTENNTEELISVKNNSTLTLKGNGKISQSASMKCGLIGVEEGSILNIYDITLESTGNRCLFSENAIINFYSGSIENSGALSGYVGGGVVLINSTFNMYGGNITNCTSKEGGAIRAIKGSVINIKGGTLNKNTAHTDNGGAIYCLDSILTIKSCEIKENSAVKSGGAIACYNTETNILEGSIINNNESKYDAGGVFSDKLLNVKDASIINNKTIYYGGGIHGNNIKVSGTSLIKNNEASFGGGILCGYMNEDQNSKGELSLTDNVIIEENKAKKLDTADWLIGVGGGVWAHTLNMDGNVIIRNNHSDRNAGGIYSRDKIIITSGIIDSNVAEGVGGGIFVFNRGFIQGTPEERVEITNNEAHDVSHHSFAGGGIFVEHPVSGAWQGPDGANLQVNNAIITNNTAAYGGGIGGCGDAVVREFDNIGASIYKNIATKNENAQDIYCDGIATITTKALGGSTISWTGVGSLDGKQIDINLKEGSASFEDIRVTAHASEQDINTANSMAGVLISGNISASGGGGIGGNGAITLGNQITAINVKKVWDDFDDFRKERPDSVSVSLVKTGMEMQDDGGYVNVNEVIDTVDLSEDNNWSYSWTGLSKYDDKNSAYVYKVIENNIPDNYVCKIEQSGINVTVTNIHTKVSFTVKKIWDDLDNKDNLRPDSIQIEVLRDGEHFDIIELKEDVDWEHLFDGLDRFDSNGNEYKFSLSEVEVPEGYTSVIHQIKEGIITIVNKHVPKEIPKISFSIKKIWDDSNNKDNLRPESIKVEVLRNNEHFETITLNDNNNWEYKFTDISKIDEDGNDYVFSVKELNVNDNYISTIKRNNFGFIITNKYVPKETINIMVKKIWDDSNDKDKLRPESIFVKLFKNDILVDNLELSDKNNWEFLYKDLEKTDNKGNDFVYSIKENNVTGYDVDISETETSLYKLFTITNKHKIDKEPEKTSIFIKKIWDDKNDKDKLRPDNIDVNIYRNNIKIDTVTLSKYNNWEYSYSDLLKYDENDNEYIYTIDEVSRINGYTSSIDGFTITNTHIPKEPEKINLFIKKTWNDFNNFDKIRPQSINVIICANKIEYKTISINESNNWQYELVNLDKYDDLGNIINYSIKEINVDGYEAFIEKKDNNFSIINTHTPKKSITVQKIWDDFDNKFNKRPDSVDINIYRNNIFYKLITLSSANNWKETLTDLDVFDSDGDEYIYSIEEKSVPNYYQSFIDNKAYTITNKYIKDTPPKTSIVIRKVWDDANDKDKLRPNSIDVNVYRDNVLFKTITLSNDNNWYYELLNLDKVDSEGNSYIYEIKEKDVPFGYLSSIDGFTITNKHIPKKETEKIEITISKIWDDFNNKNETRPENIDVEIYRNNILFKTVKIKASDNWLIVVSDLDKYDSSGKEYIYTIKEINIPDKYISSTNGFVITNKLIDTPKEPEPENPSEPDKPDEPKGPKKSTDTILITESPEPKENIKKTESPKTGDESNVYSYLLLTLLLGFILIAIGLKKEE